MNMINASRETIFASEVGDAARTPFFVLTLPRSRSKWLSVYLSPPGERACGHDLAVECESSQGFIVATGGASGTVETGAVLGWRLLRHQFPSATFIAIHRPVDEVVGSLQRVGIPATHDQMMRRARMLTKFGNSGGVTNFTFSDLCVDAVCERIFRLCLGYAAPFGWTASLQSRNIQIDVAARMKRLRERHEQLERLKAEVGA